MSYFLCNRMIVILKVKKIGFKGKSLNLNLKAIYLNYFAFLHINHDSWLQSVCDFLPLKSALLLHQHVGQQGL